MKRMKILLALLLTTFAVACGQKADDTFEKMMYFNQGLTTIKITFPDGSSISSAIGLGTTATWETLAGKPATYPSDWVTMINKPGVIELKAALEQLGYLPIPTQTTAEINAMVVPVGEAGIVKDSILDCYKIWSNGAWRILPTTN